MKRMELLGFYILIVWKTRRIESVLLGQKMGYGFSGWEESLNLVLSLILQVIVGLCIEVKLLKQWNYMKRRGAEDIKFNVSGYSAIMNCGKLLKKMVENGRGK